jgi:hypothetical protein
MTKTEKSYFAAEMLAGTPDFQAGWHAEHQVVVAMSPDTADRIGRLMIAGASTAANALDEQRLIVGAIDLFTAAARASIVAGPEVQLVPKVDLNGTPAPVSAELAAAPDSTPPEAQCLALGPHHAHDWGSLTHHWHCPGVAPTAVADEPQRAETTWTCICGEEHVRDGNALVCPPDGRMHGPTAAAAAAVQP